MDDLHGASMRQVGYAAPCVCGMAFAWRLRFSGLQILGSSFMFDNFIKWFATGQHPVFEHPTLGTFQHNDGIWTSSLRGIQLCLAGDDSQPNRGLLLAAIALLGRLPEVQDTALDFLVSQEEAPSKEDFTCYDLELLYQGTPNHFALRFILLGDDGGVWRVEFEDGAPLFLTRDE